MKGRLLGLILPASIAGLALGATTAAYRGGVISHGVFYWVWPSLVAVLYLALAFGALIMRWTKWAWPPLAAFLVQLVGLLLLVSRTITEPLDLLWYSLGTLAVGILIVLGIWLFVMFRTRALEKKLLQGTEGGDVDAQKLAQIRKDMAEALAMLRRAGKGRNAIYQLPWLLVMGRPAGGKTFAIKRSGLSLPVRQDWVKGVGGTFTADWFFTNEIIFLDTPGQWVVEGVGEDGAKHWTELLRLLRKNRGRRPLDGLVVVVPADDLLSKTKEELFEQAANVREVIDLIHDELKFRFPVYLLVSKTDLVEGFVDFFKGLPANRKHQIFGWSHPDPNDRNAVRGLRKAFQRVVRRMQAYRLEILARTASASAVRRLFFFTEEFRRLEDPLVAFADALFQADPYHETPVFRGFYFTSATQGDGAPLGQAMAGLARNLGIRLAPAGNSDDEGKRSYFLLELFRNLMVGDEGLVSRTAGHFLKRRRDTVLAAFLPAVVATGFVFFAFLSFLLNRSLDNEAAREIPKIVKSLDEDTNVSSDVLSALTKIDAIRDYHARMTGFTLFRGFGMRRPGALAVQTFRIFSEQLEARVLRPTFRNAHQIAMNENRNLADRADAFYSVVWLDQGHAVEYGDDLKGFEQIWSDLGPDKAADARARLVREFEYLLNHGSRKTDLLRDFDLGGVAAALAKGAAENGSATALRAFLDFQDDCHEPASPNEIRNCDKHLSDVLKFNEGDLERLRRNLGRLKDDLSNIEDRETGAKEAIAALRDVRLAERGDSCAEMFDREVLPSLKSYYLDDQKKLIDSCETEVNRQGKEKAVSIIETQDQAKERQNLQKAIADHVRAVNEADACKLTVERKGQLDASTVFQLSAKYRRVECVHEQDVAPRAVYAARVNPSGGGGGGSPRPAAPGGGGGSLAYFSRGGVPGTNLQTWAAKKGGLASDISYAGSLHGLEKSQKEASIRAAVQSFASQYESAWKSYLQQIRLKTPSNGGAGAWLSGLAETSDWRKVLEPAADALAVGADQQDPVLGTFDRTLAPLASVGSFLNSDLGLYQGLLASVGTDITRCEGDPVFAAKYRAALLSGDSGNGIVKGELWVIQHGGESLAEGTLKALLSKPFDVARDALGTSSDPSKRWTELVQLSTVLSRKFPFGGAASEEAASAAEIKALLGGIQGLATMLYAERGKLNLSPESLAWLDRANSLSPIFFDPGSDDIKTYKLTMTLGVDQTTIEPQKAAQSHDWRLQQFTFDLPERFEWKADTGASDTKQSTFALVGEDAPRTSRIVLVVGELKSARKNLWESYPPVNVSSADGTWAPFRVLAKLRPKGSVGERMSIPMAVPFPYKSSKKPDGKLTVSLDVQGRKLGVVLDLLERPLPPAPPHP
jgi:IcmF-related N-terminal domain